MIGWLKPDWPAPARVRALTTTRRGGVSTGGYGSLNLGDHVNDDPAAVTENRRLLRTNACLPAEPVWLRQVHGTRCVALPCAQSSVPPEADAVVTRSSRQVCAILTADCLPLLLCDTAGSVVGAAHAGWRGLLGGVIEATVAAMEQPGARLMAWLGPAIGPQAFEVGDEVRASFVAEEAASAAAFVPCPGSGGKWLCDLYALARMRLARVGVRQVSGGEHCTYAEPDLFFSYRRERQTGRMASLIWLSEQE